MKRLEDLHPHVLGHITTIEATYHIARMAIELGVPGDFVECGVYAGAQSAAMARAIMDWPAYSNDGTWRKRVHLFDSFNGFPPFSEHDKDMAAGGWKQGDTGCSLDGCKINMRRWGIPDELLAWHPGWFEATMPRAVALRTFPGDLPNTGGVHQIAVLRLDADLYESTYTALKYLYPLVSPGGWVIVDDWNLDGCRKAVQEFVPAPAPIMWRKN